jgi:hypothetical protein
MGRRNREHKVIVSQVQNNQIQEEIIECHTLFEALNFAKIHENKCVQIFDAIGVEVYVLNKHILNFIPEVKIEEIISEETETVEEIIQEISVEETKTSDVSAEVLIETPKKKPAAKKSTAKKTTNKKSQ